MSTNDPTGCEIITSLPILPLRNAVLFPGLVMPLVIGREKTLRLLDEVIEGKKTFGVVTQKDKEVMDPSPFDMYAYGSTARILRVVKERDQGLDIVVQGMSRFKVLEFTASDSYLQANIEIVPDTLGDPVELEALMRNMKTLAAESLTLTPEVPATAAEIIEQVDQPSRLLYLVTSNLQIGIEEKMRILQIADVPEAMRETLKILSHDIEVRRVTQKINIEVKGELNKSQREYLLRQQIKAIQKELGEVEDDSDVLDDIAEKIRNTKLTDEVRKIAEKELRRLRLIQPSSPEYTVARTYLDWITDLPWGVETEDNLDVEHARQVLDADHYDLVKIKRRILEHLAVSRLRNNMRGPILCLVGPPGVGKTSLGQSVAKALGRKFIRVSLGGVRDEAEIRGHRRTYIGALPGKIIHSLKRAGSSNPVFMMDEIDKLGRDWRGDPTSALLEVLDPEQNHAFMDHYLDVPFDLRGILFITTANVTDTIPAPLLDRMEMLELPGYTSEEKIEIAKRHLLPKQISENGLKPEQVNLSDQMILLVIERYTREAGVRNLERNLASLCRGIAVRFVEGKWDSPAIDAAIVNSILGPEVYQSETGDRTDTPGIATGLAWTATGGEILFVEATRMPGRGKLKLTGQLGDVMKESTQIALSYLEANAADYGITASSFADTDIHVHVPAGAIPKDGPSAGVTMFTALYSLMTDRKVRNDTAMTGEITLRGLVLPVGGIKNKVLAAHRGGIKRIIMPERNRKDLEEIPEQVRREVEFVFVSRIDGVLDQMFGPIVPAPKNDGVPGATEPGQGKESAPETQLSAHREVVSSFESDEDDEKPSNVSIEKEEELPPLPWLHE